MTDSVGSFSDMLLRALGNRLVPGTATFAEMFAEDGVIEFPFTFAGMPERLQGRPALVDYLAELGGSIDFERVGEPTVHAMADPDLVVLEFEGFGRGVATGEPYEQRYVSIVRTRNGRIVHYKDYWNPLAVLRTTRGSKAVVALVGGEAKP